jgi:hypothetical protein
MLTCARYNAIGHKMKSGLALAICASVIAACSGVANTAAVAQDTPIMSRELSQDQPPGAACVANLPFSRGKSFCCLDEYLAHLEQQGAIDLPWWREIGPGLYERVTRMPEAARETATREELMRRFGFSC